MGTIPKQVKTAAKALIQMYGEHFEHLGKSGGADFYLFKFPEDVDAGFPFVYKIKGDNVSEITGPDALKTVGLFIKD